MAQRKFPLRHLLFYNLQINLDDCIMPNEVLDVVNDQDIVIGRELRTVVHRRGLQHRGVHVFLFTREGRLLIQQRSKDRAASPSLLDGSVSEHVQAGEDYMTAAIRGMREELGLEGIDIQPIVTFRMNYGPNDNEISRLFLGTVEPAIVQFNPVEIEKITYLGLVELLERMGTAEDDFCSWFVQIIRWAIGRPSELSILKIHENVHLPWLPIK
jgi:16S rRNA (adenine1518-N6/adenine1519-N6)-dimethyltransferase